MNLISLSYIQMAAREKFWMVKFDKLIYKNSSMFPWVFPPSDFVPYISHYVAI